ncbi:hypothetical protein AVEN_109060-1 [Araneus ventricosus]|uniref:CCHC-type domain-containing protein n=3 Tax=Araneus ventricosus TaxID=182803 RepID=A0A4Y2JZR9_ARAVE|nr:hypothetical protein AVEN_109060-1 [Araneus ventricosus]
MGSRNLAPDGEMRPSTSPEKEYHIHERFFIAKVKDGSINTVSAILIHKAILANVGEVKSVKKCKNGDLLIEVWSEQQATAILKMKHIGNYEVTVTAHSRLNQSKGVISESELQNDTEDDILEELRAQNVTAVKRIFIKKEGRLLPTKHLILTFNLPSIPKSVHIAYFNLSVRPYIPNPLRCYKCQKFGHTIQACRGTQTCPRCSLADHDGKTCDSTPRCVNCKGDHPAYFKSCPRWKEEKEIQTIKVKQNLSFAEARKIVIDRTPKVGVSYAAAIKKIMVSTSTQYDPEPQLTENPTILVNSQKKSISNRNNLDKTVKEPSPSKNKSASNEHTGNLSRIPTSKPNQTEKPGRVSKFFKETKAMKKARLAATKKNLDHKIKDSIKKRTITKHDLLKQSNSKDNESDGISIHPSDDDVMSTDGEENPTKT